MSYLDEYGDPSEDMINDWNIHNDHQDDELDGHSDGDDSMYPEEDFQPCLRSYCMESFCDNPDHFALTPEELDEIFSS